VKALLLAAGKATRLGELSATTPKCLHRVGEEVLLDRVIRQLQEAGVEEFLINTHHLADRIVEHVARRTDHGDFTLVYEPELLGTLGTYRANSDFFGGEPGWVLHADNFIEGSLTDLRDGFSSRPARAWGSMLTFHADDPTSCGVVLTDQESVVTGFFEKVPDPPSEQASAATFILGPHVLEVASQLPRTSSDISNDLLPRLIGHLTAVRHRGNVIDIGTPAGLRRAQMVVGLPPSGA
jgi:mannose-1-phosphate guanylyltransferase